MAQVFAYLVHKDGALDDSAMELVVAAKAIGDDVTAVVTGSGIDAVADEAAKIFPKVIKIDDAALAYPNAEVVRKALVNVIPAGSVVLFANNTFAMDCAPGLSIKMDAAYVSDVIGLEADGTTLKTVRQEFGGEVNTHVDVDAAGGAVVTLRPGTFAADESKSAGGSVEAAAAGDIAAKRTFIEIVEPEAGDVDITKADLLVSIGRGIEDEDNIEIAHELAEALGAGAEVSCSRPIVDAKWLEPSRQVGTSGCTVKPKVYLACGISGSFQHMGGIKGGVVIAINKNENAPIFQVANVGIVADILEFLPELTEAIGDL
ncbi:electron transfer flavoprotein subunit alpha [Desulfoluna limicola]|uniref:Electron transfer flavoprotein subunit alpha n=1 Tax=Desulfoluna limicola TaxID=2810562 RepID=A0ABM7PKX5_9BACT|nr:electron transfer flavoprotein subunit alpha/FixB family protein [Desulfoluna limicola]BCS98204.1 electron transfer flavoprotein subunit alpha [Desulfoluna limicola]